MGANGRQPRGRAVRPLRIEAGIVGAAGQGLTVGSQGTPPTTEWARIALKSVHGSFF
jgi:hypothetical protein